MSGLRRAAPLAFHLTLLIKALSAQTGASQMGYQFPTGRIENVQSALQGIGPLAENFCKPGVADKSACLNAAIAVGGTIRLQPGTYTLQTATLTIPDNTHVVCSGPGATIINATGAFPVVTFLNSQNSSIDGCTIQSMNDAVMIQTTNVGHPSLNNVVSNSTIQAVADTFAGIHMNTTACCVYFPTVANVTISGANPVGTRVGILADGSGGGAIGAQVFGGRITNVLKGLYHTAGDSFRFFGTAFDGITDGTGGDGIVNTSGTAVTWVSGPQFSAAQAGKAIIINAVSYTIVAFVDVTHVTLASTAGTQSAVSYHIQGGGIMAEVSTEGDSFQSVRIENNAVDIFVQLDAGAYDFSLYATDITAMSAGQFVDNSTHSVTHTICCGSSYDQVGYAQKFMQAVSMNPGAIFSIPGTTTAEFPVGGAVSSGHLSGYTPLMTLKSPNTASAPALLEECDGSSNPLCAAFVSQDFNSVDTGNALILTPTGAITAITGGSASGPFNFNAGVNLTFGSTGTPFSALGAPPNGTIYYCRDCKNVVNDAATPGATCVGSGSGSVARRENSAWHCN